MTTGQRVWQPFFFSGTRVNSRAEWEELVWKYLEQHIPLTVLLQACSGPTHGQRVRHFGISDEFDRRPTLEEWAVKQGIVLSL